MGFRIIKNRVLKMEKSFDYHNFSYLCFLVKLSRELSPSITNTITITGSSIIRFRIQPEELPVYRDNPYQTMIVCISRSILIHSSRVFGYLCFIIILVRKQFIPVSSFELTLPWGLIAGCNLLIV